MSGPDAPATSAIATGTPQPARATVTPRRRAVVALLLFLGLFLAYHANTTVLDEGDAVSSANLPLALLSTGRPSFDPDHFPEMFKWKSKAPLVEKDDFFFMTWREVLGDRTASEWRSSGELSFAGPRYYLVPSERQHTYVSTFGPVPGLVLLPVVAPFYAVDHYLGEKMALRASVAKIGASLIVALTATLLFLVALRVTTLPRALLVAITYGLGTCAWAVSSQNIWQQTVTQLFLTLGAFFALSSVESRRTAALAGLALGVATACRVTGVVALGFVALHLLVYRRKSLVPFLVGSLPAPLALAAYNFHYFGSPFTLGQGLIGHVIAMEKTGSPDLWQTPFFTGLAGLLVSPSRGLLVFSPVLGLAFWGMARAVRVAEWRALRPLAAAALVLMAIQCKWFDWWGGHAYGYRPWLDAVPYLCLLLLPVLPSVLGSRPAKAAFAVVLAWSIFVQFVGAWTYDRSWNLRQIFVVRVPGQVDAVSFLTDADARAFLATHEGTYIGPSFCDIDLTFCRDRLWSVKDNMIQYHLTHWAETRGRRFRSAFGDLGGE